VDSSDPSNPLLGNRFQEALRYAASLHSGQRRKGTEVPYISHPLSVAALVLEDGGDEEEAIAALLHDAVEDQGGLETFKEIRRRFGSSVAYIVEGCTDSWETPKPPWRKRKEEHILLLREASPRVLRVAVADKLHNARSILWELRHNGEGIWSRFKGGREGTLWYYRTLANQFLESGDGPMVRELDRVVTEMERLAAPPPGKKHNG
jgi:(p)ppGpp synthase/HD superfamily hydrolase